MFLNRLNQSKQNFSMGAAGMLNGTILHCALCDPVLGSHKARGIFQSL